jgi:hypothetical protein
VILFDHYLAALPDLIENGMDVARQLGFADVQCCHTSDHTSSTSSFASKCAAPRV